MNVTTTTTCDFCGIEFTYVRTRIARKYCCDNHRTRAGALRQRLRNKGEALSEQELKDLMRSVAAQGPRKRTQKVDGSMYPAGRVCAYDENEIGCITRLCRYNPGPYCFMHAQQIADSLLADAERKRAEELREAESKAA